MSEPPARGPQFVGPARVPEEYRAKLEAARARVRGALDPQTDAEEAVVAWLGQWEDTTMDLISDMVERRTTALARIETLVPEDYTADDPCTGDAMTVAEIHQVLHGSPILKAAWGGTVNPLDL